MDMVQVLKTGMQLLDEIKDVNALVKASLTTTKSMEEVLKKKEKGLIDREKAVAGMEAVQTVEQNIKKLRALLDEERRVFEEDKAAFENSVIAEREKLQDESASLSPVRDLANQVRLDKLALIERENTYREKIRKELMDKIKTGA